VGDPINFGTGNEYREDTDLALGSLTFHRYYNSHVSTASAHLGAHWRHVYDRSVISYGQIATAFRSDGRQFYFIASGGAWTPDADVADTLSQVNDAGGNLIGWSYTDASTREVESYDAQGNLLSITDLNGQITTLAYSTASTPASVAPKTGLLITVTDSRGRQLSFTYNTQSNISAVTQPDGSATSYAYDANGNLNKVTYPDTQYRQYVYNESTLTSNTNLPHALTGLIDENGTRLADIGYDSQGRGTLSRLAGGVNISQVSYGADGTNTVTFPSGVQVTYGFAIPNGSMHANAANGPCGSNCNQPYASRSFDANGYPSQATDFNGHIKQTTYNTRGLLTSQVDAQGESTQRTINTTWDANFRVPDQRTVLNASNVTESLTNWGYNARGQVTARCEVDTAVTGASSYTCGSATNAPNGVRQTTYTYCEQAGVTAGTCPIVGLVLTATSPRTDLSSVTTYSYYQTTDLAGCATVGGTCHNLGDLYQVSNALNQTTTYVSYDKNGRVTRQIDANGTLTDMAYHARGWLLTRTVRANASASANDATTTFDYDYVGQVKKITQPDGAYLSYTYDASHRLTDITDNLSNTIHYTLDAAGNRTNESTKDPSGTLKRSLSRQYSQLNRLTKVLNAASATVQQYTNPAEAPPSGVTYTDGYDGNGNAIYSVDGNSVGTEQQYDPLNRLVKTLQDHAGTGTTKDTTTQYAYDARDNLRSVSDPDGLVTSYTYDGLNNLTDLSSPDTGGTGYTYDAAGNRKTQTDARGVVTTYSYDALNRLTGISYPTTSLNVTYTYDQTQTGCYNTGRLTTITDSSGSTGYCYDRRGNVVTKQQTTGGTVSTLGYTYTVADRLSTITYPSGAIVTYTRNSLGQITGVAYQSSATATAQTLISSATYLPFGPLNVLTFGNGRSLTKTYDQDYAISQVVSSATAGLTVAATVDVLGNLTSASNIVGANPPTQKYLYDPLYRLTTSETGAATPSILEQYAYGKTGDRTSAALNGASAATYSYTAGTHRLSSIGATSRTYDANGNTQTNGTATLTYDDRNRLATANGSSYAYNGKGERMSKTGSSTTVFVYGEGGQLVGEYTGGQAQEYVYLDGTPIGIATSGTSSQLYYVEADQLGSPRTVVQPGATTTSDTLVWSWDYFGSTFGTNAPSPQTLALNLRFPGQYFDPETGLHYNYFRDYEPATGRYIEFDPIGLGGGPNGYAYVRGAPLSSTDPKGLQTTADTWCRQNPVECALILGGGAALVPKPGTDTTDSSKVQSKEKCKSCADFPEYDLCSEMSRYYPYDSAAEALSDFPPGSKKRSGMPATGGFCAVKGIHHTVVLNGAYVGSIFSCHCCKNTPEGADFKEIWGNNRGR